MIAQQKIMEELKKFIENNFKTSLDTYLEAIKTSPSAQGYTLGAISEVLVINDLIKKGFEAKRIKEKPKGGAHGKSAEARGDFYIRKNGNKKWLVLEVKGLKSNSEFSYSRRKQLNNKKGLKSFLLKHAIKGHQNDISSYNRAKKSYQNSKNKWLIKNRNKTFPPFKWSKEKPGPCNCNLTHIWKNEKELKEWINSLNEKDFTEENYRLLKGPIVILETHAPSIREAPLTKIKQASPLVQDFSIMAVDIFIKRRNHEFVFMNPNLMNHSPKSPEHLYQNYIIDILIPGIKDTPIIEPPWYKDIDEVIATNPVERDIDTSQIDDRSTLLIPD